MSGNKHPPQIIAVTGATGFTGPFVIEALRTTFPSARIRAVARSTSDSAVIKGRCHEHVIADLRDTEALTSAFDGADTLVNVASLGQNWVASIVTAATVARVRRSIFIGTTAMLTTLPVASRALREEGERRVMASGMAWTILRPTMIYGTPRDRNIARLIRFVRRSPVVPLVAPHARQQPVHVEDVSQAVAAALGSDVTIGRAYNISGETAITLENLVRTVIRALGVTRLVVKVPMWLPLVAASVWSRGGRPPVTPEQIRRLAEDKDFDHSEAARDFGFRPRSFETGVRNEVRLINALQ